MRERWHQPQTRQPTMYAVMIRWEAVNTISSVVPFLVAKVAQAAGADPEPLLRGTGVDSDKPPPAEEHVDAAKYFEVWKRAVALFGPAFPFAVTRAVTLEDHEVFGFLAISCSTLGQAYEKTAAYRALYCVGARWELVLTAEASRLIWFSWPGDASDPGYQAANEFAVADMVDSIKRLGATQPMPRAVRSPHPLATEFYGVAPVKSALYELVYDAGLTEQPISSFNAKLRDYFDATCKQVVAALPAGDTMTAQLRKALIATMDGGDVSMEAIAKKLATSSRTLQRRLAEENTSYNDVLAEVRIEFAKRYLSRGTMSASEVAYLVGFTEPPAFFKAFKRWTGMTPKEFQLAR